MVVVPQDNSNHMMVIPQMVIPQNNTTATATTAVTTATTSSALAQTNALAQHGGGNGFTQPRSRPFVPHTNVMKTPRPNSQSNSPVTPIMSAMKTPLSARCVTFASSLDTPTDGDSSDGDGDSTASDGCSDSAPSDGDLTPLRGGPWMHREVEEEDGEVEEEEEDVDDNDVDDAGDGLPSSIIPSVVVVDNNMAGPTMTIPTTSMSALQVVPDSHGWEEEWDRWSGSQHSHHHHHHHRSGHGHGHGDHTKELDNVPSSSSSSLSSSSSSRCNFSFASTPSSTLSAIRYCRIIIVI